jgi:hypothetical protein
MSIHTLITDIFNLIQFPLARENTLGQRTFRLLVLWRVLWVVMLRSSERARRFGRTYRCAFLRNVALSSNFTVLQPRIPYSSCLFCIVARMWRLYETGFGLSTGFTGSQYSTLNYSAHTLQPTRSWVSLTSFQAGNYTYGIPCHHFSSA